MKKFKRLIALVLSLIMVLSLAACSNPVDQTTEAPKQSDASETEGSETNAPTDAQEFNPRSITEGVTLTVAIADDDEVIDWETNLVTKMIEEEFGVDLKFEAYASADFNDKLNVMIQGGDELPDIIMGSSVKGLNSLISGWVASEALIDLSEYYENPDYAKHINLASERLGFEVYEALYDASGKIWSLPKYYPEGVDITAHKMWVNTEYAKTVGYDEIPTDTEGFFELCKAFAEAGDVDGDGVDDEYPLLAYAGLGQNWFKFLMSPYVYAWGSSNLVVEDGNLSFAFATEEWKEGLKYIKRYFDAGILDSSAITMDANTYKAIATDLESCYLADVYYCPRLNSDDAVEKALACLEYTFIPALDGADAYYAAPRSYAGAVITVDCENPEAAFIVLDYMCSETISICNRYGEEGVDWDYWENVDESKLIEGTTKDMYMAHDGSEPDFVYYSKTYWGTGTPQNAGYMQGGPAILFPNAAGEALQNATTDDAKALQDYNVLYYIDNVQGMMERKPDEYITYLPMTAEENERASEIYNLLKSYYREAGAKFITGEWDIDEQWDAYLAELEKMEMSEALEIYQTSYDRTK